jgi:hypothetical protein
VAAATCALLVAPYLFNCWRTLGDPLVSINSHTGYYRGAVGLEGSTSVGRYLATARPPWEALDVALYGLIVNPFERQWGGFDWLPVDPGPALAGLAALGALALLVTPRGRALIGLALCAVAPFAFTWDLPGGGEWRFTLVAYPFLLIAASLALVQGVALVRGGRAAIPPDWTPHRALGVAASVLALASVLLTLPALRASEATRRARLLTVPSGPRDLSFTLGRGWRWPRAQGALRVRDCAGECSLRIPRADRAQVLRLRVGPAGAAEVLIEAQLDGVALGGTVLKPDPERMGDWELELPPAPAPGWATLELKAQAPIVLWYWSLRPG